MTNHRSNKAGSGARNLAFVVGCLIAMGVPVDAQFIDFQHATARIQDPVDGPDVPPLAIAKPGVLPSGVVPPVCKPFINKGPLALDGLLNCYLNDPGNKWLAMDITWSFNGMPATEWKNWPAWAKSDLSKAFANTIAWYNGGMTKYPGTLVQDPPVALNTVSLALGKHVPPVYDEKTVAWPIYLGHVALSLAAEIYGWVPWSVHNYNNAALSYVLGSQNFFWYSSQEVGWVPQFTSTPANATYVFKFLKTNNLIGPTTVDTIARVLDWARQNLWHTSGNFGYQQMFYFFNYWGEPPVSRIIEGTVTTDPKTPYFWGAPHHWTAGCYGTTSFLIWVMKAVNIPVNGVNVGYHSAPEFIGEKLFLSHGDDPYSADAKSAAPATLFLIDQATYDAWFPANDPVAGDKNVGRRIVELNLTYPSPWVLNMYCDDIANGKDHASGKVFNNYFKPYYTVAQLEGMGLWTLLDQKMVNYACSMP